MLALDHWGLVPERDKIQFRILGDQSVIAQGLLTGAVDAAYLGYTFSKVAQRQGFHVLADLAKVDIPYQGIGVAARRSFLDRSPEIAERTLKALARSVAYIQEPANKPSVVAILAKWLRLSRVEDAEAGFEAVEVEPTRIYRASDVRQVFEGYKGLLEEIGRQGLRLDDLLTEADGKYRSAFIRAVKPTSFSSPM